MTVNPVEPSRWPRALQNSAWPKPLQSLLKTVTCNSNCFSHSHASNEHRGLVCLQAEQWILTRDHTATVLWRSVIQVRESNTYACYTMTSLIFLRSLCYLMYVGDLIQSVVEPSSACYSESGRKQISVEAQFSVHQNGALGTEVSATTLANP